MQEGVDLKHFILMTDYKLSSVDFKNFIMVSSLAFYTGDMGSISGADIQAVWAHA